VAELPENLGAVRRRASPYNRVEFAQGDLRTDPAIVALERVALPPGLAPRAALQRANAAFAREPQAGAKAVSAPRIHSVHGRPLVTSEHALASGLTLERAAIMSGSEMWRVEVEYWPRYRAQWAAAATRIAVSMRISP
jgi:hypothetical protein